MALGSVSETSSFLKPREGHEEHHGDCLERRKFFHIISENSEVPGRQEKRTHLDCIKKTKPPMPAISQIRRTDPQGKKFLKNQTKNPNKTSKTPLKKTPENDRMVFRSCSSPLEEGRKGGWGRNHSSVFMRANIHNLSLSRGRMACTPSDK